jgi:nicotinamide-nucleotide amidase
MSNPTPLNSPLVTQLASQLLRRQWFLATAESCTGGMIAAACTDLAGSSAWFDRGLVTYSNAAKTELLGVDAQLIQAHGAVSEPVARAMVQGAIQHSAAQVAVAVTGVAGPTGGSATKPLGTVWFGFAVAGHVLTEHRCFKPDAPLADPKIRAYVRSATVAYALQRLVALTA